MFLRSDFASGNVVTYGQKPLATARGRNRRKNDPLAQEREQKYFCRHYNQRIVYTLGWALSLSVL